MVVLLAESHVDGNMVLNTGSSLYSREIITHISMPVLSINEGKTVLKRSSSISSTTRACSLSGNTTWA